MTPRTVNSKKTWGDRISKLIGRLFGIVRTLIRFCWEAIEQCMYTIAFFFSLLLRVVANPSTPAVIAILFFIAVSAVAALQWWAIGVWLGSAFGMGGAIGGISSGILGMLGGLGLNTWQIAPELWKLRRDVAKSYGQLGVDPEYDTSESTLSDRILNWFSYDHQTLKRGRLIAYAIETGLVVAYCGLAQRFAFVSLVQAAISLFLPEKALAMIAASVSLLSEVNERINKETTEDAAGTSSSQQQANNSTSQGRNRKGTTI